MLSFAVFLDYLYYGRITFTPANFFVINLSGVSLFYGGNPWHYYASQALPILCATSLPFVLLGLWNNFDRPDPATKNLSRTILWTLGVYSVIGHKEWRFIHPLLPLMHVLAAQSLVDLSSGKNGKEQLVEPLRPYSLRRKYFYALIIPIPIAVFVVLLYCSAPITVLSYIRSIPSNDLRGGSIGFLMPCHSTPGHAYIHRPELAVGGMWALGCEPPLEYVFHYMNAVQDFYQRFQQTKSIDVSGSDRRLLRGTLRISTPAFPAQCQSSFPKITFSDFYPRCAKPGWLSKLPMGTRMAPPSRILWSSARGRTCQRVAG